MDARATIEVTTAEAQADAAFARVTWRLIPLLALCYLSAYVDRSNIGIAKLQFTRDLGITEAMYGFGGGIFYLGYSLFEVPSNLLMQRIGARRTIARALLLWSLCSAATAFIATQWHFYGLRFLLGAAEAGFFPGVLLYLSQWAPAPRRARMTALFMSSLALAGVVSNPVSGFVLHGLNGAAGLRGWQWLFLIEGLPGCLLAAAALVWLTDQPAQARWLTQTQRDLVIAELAAEAHANAPIQQARFGQALRDRRFWAMAGMSMAMIAGLAGLSLWVPTIVQRSGIHDLWRIGLLSALPYLFGVVAQQAIARHSDRTGERRWHACVPALIAACAWMVLPAVRDHTAWSLGILIVLAMGMFGATGPFWSLPATYLRGTAAAGGIAVITTAGGLAAFVSPIVVGWATQRTGQLAFGQYYFGTLLALATLVLLVCLRPRP